MSSATASAAPTVLGNRIAALMQLARNAEPEARAHLYNSVAELVVARGEQLTDHERSLVRQILAMLTRQVETQVRRALALRLADRPDAPHDLILMLANDAITVAEPVIIASPVLTESDLVLIIRHATSAHQHLVARRPEIGPRVSEALIEHGNDNVLATLLGNETAVIPDQALRMLLNRAAVNPKLQPALVHRDDLPADILSALYRMVSGALRDHLQSQYGSESALIRSALPDALDDAQLPGNDLHDEDALAAQLVEKLQRGKTLGPSFLMKALSQNQKPVFVHGLARLLGATPETVRRIIDFADVRPLALAARAINIDRSAFINMRNLLKGGDTAALDVSQKMFLDEVFLRMTAQDAAHRLQRSGILR